MSEKEGTPFSQKTPASVTKTCVKVRKQGEYRYSSSPLGKRIDIYETSETEDDTSAFNPKSVASDNSLRVDEPDLPIGKKKQIECSSSSQMVDDDELQD